MLQEEKQRGNEILNKIYKDNKGIKRQNNIFQKKFIE